MFWNKPNKDKRKKTSDLQRCSKEGNNKNNKHSQGKTGDALRAQALANARTARENLGDDTIQKLTEIMKKKEQSTIEKAKVQIQNADTDRVVDEILSMMDEN